MELGIGGLEDAQIVGAGGSAVVYRAYQPDLDREVAVKVLKLTDESFVKRFQLEARTLGKLSQRPGIVTIYDNGLTDEGRPYLILEFCESSLHDQLRDGPFPVEQACRVVAEIAEAVAAAHDNGVVHRDLKPGNILVSPLGRYLVADFGISAVGDTSVGDTGSIGFTAGYVAPEILMENQAERPADVYALGATLFHLLAGHPPFIDSDHNPNLFAIAQRVISDPVPDLSNEGVDPRVAEIASQAMAKDPADRPTASELASLLRELLPELESQKTSDTIIAASPMPVDENPTSADATEETQSKVGGVLESPDNDGSTVAVLPQGATVTMGVASTNDHSGLDRGIVAPAPRYDDASRGRLPIVVMAALLAAATLGALAFLVPQFRTGGESTEIPTEVVGADEETNSGDESVSVESADGSGATGRFDTASDFDTTVEIPDVIGVDLTQAQATLEDAGLEVTVTSRRTSSASANSVLETDPEPGDLVEEGSTIIVVVAREALIPTVIVPELVGETEGAARILLTDLDLVARTVLVPKPLAEVAAGSVVSVTPAGGSQVEEGSEVRLVVSSGPICPDQVGLGGVDAIANLEGVGLTVTASQAESRTVAADDVISCTHSGTEAALVVSSGTPADLCEGIVGLTQTEAETQLDPSGLDLVVENESGTAPLNQVTSCVVAASSVTLTVSTGPAPECPAGLAGLPAAEAEAQILAAGFATVTTVTVNHETIPAGAVVACRPISETEAELSVSDGAGLILIPNLAGTPGAAAKAKLQALGLVFDGTRVVANTRPEGDVVRTIPAAGTEVEAGTAVEVLVSNGAAAVIVPDVVGRTQKQATNALENLGFTVAVNTEESDTVVPGVVIAHAPVAGTSRPAGTRVTLTVAEAPPP